MRKRSSRGITERIFLGFLLPLFFLLTVGVVGPIVLSSLSQARIRDRDRAARLAQQIGVMHESANDTEEHGRDLLRYGGDEFRERLRLSQRTYNNALGMAHTYAENDPRMEQRITTTDKKFQQWVHRELTFRMGIFHVGEWKSGAGGLNEAYIPVRQSFDALADFAEREKARREERAQAIEQLRNAVTVPVLAVALVVSVLIGRSIALSITQPLQELRSAAEEVERFGTLRLPESKTVAPLEEIADLEQSFLRMARTVEQRAALLRAQNEALGALNRRVEAVLDATTEGIVMLDRSGGFSVVSRRFAYFFGMEPESLMQQTYEQAAPQILGRFRQSETVRHRFREIIDDAHAIADETYEIVEPMPRILRIYSAPVLGRRDVTKPDDEPELLGRIFVFRDVTRESAVDQMKTEFVSTVSHELRTPLTAIKGYVDLMVGGATGEINETQHEFLTVVQQSTARLTALINDMLDISRIEAGRIEVNFKAIDYLQVVRSALQMMQTEAHKKSIALTLQMTGNEADVPAVYGDPDRVMQVLVNFLSNGIKYTPPGGSVTVLVESEETFVTTCVADTGIGVSAEDLPRLFQKFFRADNRTTREAGGTGLGLAISKAILEKLHGSVWVESKQGQGSRFWFTLPAFAPNTAAEENISGGDVLDSLSGVARGLILQIGDDVPGLRLLSRQLRHGGYAVTTAFDLPDALRRARDLRPDALVFDPLMPGLDGLTLLQELRDDPQTDTLPIFAVSVDGRRSKDGELRDHLRYLQKPVKAVDLRTALEDGLSVSDGKGERKILVVGIGLAEPVRSLSGVFPKAVLDFAAGQNAAERQARQNAPDLLVIDAEGLTDGTARGLIAALLRAPATAHIRAIVVTAKPVQQRNVVFPVPFAKGVVPAERLTEIVEGYLGGGNRSAVDIAKSEPSATIVVAA